MSHTTKDLVKKCLTGSHRIRETRVERWSLKLKEWVSEPNWRKDVIRRASIELMFK